MYMCVCVRACVSFILKQGAQGGGGVHLDRVYPVVRVGRSTLRQGKGGRGGVHFNRVYHIFTCNIL